MGRTKLAILALATTLSYAASAQQAPVENPTDLQEYDDWGSWQKVLDKDEINRETHIYQQRLAEIGIAATVHSCRFVSEINRGVAGGAVATGGLCSITIGSKPKRNFWVCENRLGSFNISDAQEYGLDYETSKRFIGNTCWIF